VQFIHDLLLITSVVHITGGADSQFAAMYILVNAAAALLLPIGSSLLLALLGSALYAGDAFLVSGGDLTVALVLQLVVFTLVAVGTGYIAARLQEAGEGRERLQAELASMRHRGIVLQRVKKSLVPFFEYCLSQLRDPLEHQVLAYLIHMNKPVNPKDVAQALGCSNMKLIANTLCFMGFIGRWIREEEATLSVNSQLFNEWYRETRIS
jgi:hypothetical protein